MLKRFVPLAVAGVAGLLLGGCGTASTVVSTPTPTVNFGPQLTVPKTAGTPSSSPAKSSRAKKSSGSSGKSSPASGSSSSSASGSSGAPLTEGQALAAAHARQKAAAQQVQTQTVTVTTTITKTRNPDVPAGAHLPSSHRALHLSTFVTAGGGVACQLGDDSVRCDIRARAWTASAKPKSCKDSYGHGLTVAGDAMPSFVCASNSLFAPHLSIVPTGYDDSLNGVTCQVRSFGVTCFDEAGHGFFIDYTGYAEF